ncbi:MAG: AraC family transcriptional regulator [Victivallaceae bacterium]|nr:AraC family transcriptional regulator [Victivallaceae bacterium]
MYLFEFVLKQYGFLEIASRRYDCAAGSYFMIPPDADDNKYWAAPGVIQEKIFFICRGTLVRALLESYGLEKSYLVPNARELVKYFYNMLILTKQSGAGKNREAALVFHKFIQGAQAVVYPDDEPPLPPTVKKLQLILDAHLEKKLNFAAISREITYSQAYIVRLFKRHLGVTPYEYLLQRRVETAQLLLRYSTLSIKEIAERLVFSDQYHFSNCFRKRLGVSPSRFRNPESASDPE